MWERKRERDTEKVDKSTSAQPHRWICQKLKNLSIKADFKNKPKKEKIRTFVWWSRKMARAHSKTSSTRPHRCMDSSGGGDIKSNEDFDSWPVFPDTGSVIWLINIRSGRIHRTWKYSYSAKRPILRRVGFTDCEPILSTEISFDGIEAKHLRYCVFGLEWGLFLMMPSQIVRS